jgi:hypothetical protein
MRRVDATFFSGITKIVSNGAGKGGYHTPSSTMSASAKHAAELATQMGDMLQVIQILEERLRELKQMARKGERKAQRRGGKAAGTAAAAAARPARPPNAWILFTQRVKTLVVAAGLPFAKVTDALKFCKELKDGRGGYGWSDEEIVAARRDWEPPTPVHSVKDEEEAESVASAEEISICPTCTGVIEEDASAHRACLISVTEAAKAAGADPMKAVDAWSESISRVVLPVAARPVALAPPGRSSTPLRRLSGTAAAATLSVPQLQHPPPISVPALNTLPEEMVIDDV